MFPKLYKFIATLLIPVMALGSLPLVGHAGIVSTEEALVTPAGDADRTKVSSFLARDEVRQALTSQGVDTDQATGRLLGAEMCAPQGEHMAHLLALAIQQKLTVHDLLGMPFYHPTLEEGLRTALRDTARQLPQGRESDLATCTAIGVAALE